MVLTSERHGRGCCSSELRRLLDYVAFKSWEGLGNIALGRLRDVKQFTQELMTIFGRAGTCELGLVM